MLRPAGEDLRKMSRLQQDTSPCSLFFPRLGKEEITLQLSAQSDLLREPMGVLHIAQS